VECETRIKESHDSEDMLSRPGIFYERAKNLMQLLLCPDLCFTLAYLLVLEIDCMHQNIAGGGNAGLALLCVLLDCGFVSRVAAKKLLHTIADRGISEQPFGFIVHKARMGSKSEIAF
jgi:hypothetical protein